MSARPRSAPRFVLLAALIGAVGSPSSARGAPPALDESVEIGRPPRPLRVRVAEEDGRVLLRVGPRPVALPLTHVATARIEVVTLAGGARVAVVRASADGREVAALVVRQGASQPVVSWIGHLDLRGDPGERTAGAIEVHDRTGDEFADIVVGRHDERARLCGQERTLLDARALDPGTLTLRPVLLDRLGPAPAGTPVLDATVRAPGTGAPPLVRSLRPAGASSRAGSAEPTSSPPLEITDGDARTYWVEAYGGASRGEFVTLRRDSALFPIRALALVLHPVDARASERIARPRTLWFVGDGGARLQVRIPESAFSEAGARVWIEPAAPLAWGCLSVAFDEHHVAEGSAPGFGAIAEIEAYTDLDFGGGAQALVDAMNGEGQRADDAALYALTLGAPVLPALEGGWSGLGAPGKRRALRVLAALAPREAGARRLLVRGLADAEASIRDGALGALAGAGPAGLAELVPLVAEPGTLGDAAALALARDAPEIAIAPLLDATARAGGSERPALREALGLVTRNVPEGTVTQVRSWSASAEVPIAARAALALALAPVPEAHGVVGSLLADAATAASEFPDLWRFVHAAAALPAQPATDAWLGKLARGEARWMLRTAALEALEARHSAGAREAARAALADPYPRVRLEALGMLADDPTSFARIAEHARRDTWTMVRVAAIEAIALQPGAEKVLREAVGDRRRRVRAAAIDGLARAGVKSAWPLVEEKLTDDEEWPEVASAAVRYVRTLCVREAEDALLATLERGMRPDAWEPDVRLALEAFGALAALGGEGARRARTLATTPAAPEGFRATARRASRERPACEGR